MSNKQRKTPLQAQQRHHTTLTNHKPAYWRLSVETAKNLNLPLKSENWENHPIKSKCLQRKGVYKYDS
jgi:hypothetical protein